MASTKKQQKGTSDPENFISRLGDTNDAVRRDARRALVAMGKGAVPFLVEALKRSDDLMRWEAVKALCELEDPDTAPVFVRTLEDSEFGVRWLAAKGLTELNVKGLKPLLRALISKGDYELVREGAHHVFVSLAKGELKKYMTPLLSALEGPAPAVQAPVAAMHALEMLEKDHKL